MEVNNIEQRMSIESKKMLEITKKRSAVIRFPASEHLALIRVQIDAAVG